MIKILHSADWHLDSPLLFRDPRQVECLREAARRLPDTLVQLCQDHSCDLVLLSGDLFDGAYTAESCQRLRTALAQIKVPVFISPGNHDHIGHDSPWLSEHWPENVHIFMHPAIESVALPHLDCRVYGGGFTDMDCPPLLESFSAQQTETYAIGILHADPTQVNSPYCPVTTEQVRASNLDYLALGHIHKGGSFHAGKTLCAWPGCPMGRGYDELGEKGMLLVTLDETVQTRFLPVSAPQFHDMEVPADQNLHELLPPVGNNDFYRITFTGQGSPVNTQQLLQEFSHFPNLSLRDKTTPPTDLWGSAGEDTLEGMYFKLLQDGMQTEDEVQQRRIRLAAQISRQILDGQEVVLP